MAQYNLIRNGAIRTLSEVAGDISLSFTELEPLIDGDTTTSGAAVASNEQLKLEAVLPARIQVDEIRLYASVGGATTNVWFEYKNAAGDSYTTLSGAYHASGYYYATVPDPSAPLYVKAVVSGIALNVNEYEIYNDDYIVAFGEDGELYAEYITDAPVGSDGTPQAVPIFNNDTLGSNNADAYVTIDYTGTDADSYVEISTSYGGTYYSMSDGLLIGDNASSSDMYWDMGSYSNVVVNANDLILDEMASAFTYAALGMINQDVQFDGTSHVWDYDSVNDKIYAAGSDGILKLWEFDYGNRQFNYLHELATGVGNHAQHFSIAYLDGDIYCLVDPNDTAEFGKCTPGGAVDNWTSLTSPSIPVDSQDAADKHIIFSDYNEYIYLIVLNYAACGVAPTGAYFARYSTVSGAAVGWETLSDKYDMNCYTGGGSSNLASKLTAAYDTDRDYIYLILGEGSSGNWEYMQRYEVATNTWTTDFFNYAPIFSVEEENDTAIWYYNNKVWMWGQFIGNIKCLDLLTWQVDTYSLPFDGEVYQQGWRNHNMIAIPPVYAGLDATVFMVGVDADENNVYALNAVLTSGTYNTPVLKFDDSNPSYVMVDVTTTSGDTTVSYNPDYHNGTIRVKSSSTAPEPLNEILVWRESSSPTQYNDQLYRYTVSTAEEELLTEWGDNSQQYRPRLSVGDRRRGNIVVSRWLHTAYGNSQVYLYDYNLNLLGSKLGDQKHGANLGLSFDKNGGFWGAVAFSTYNSIVHYDIDTTILGEENFGAAQAAYWCVAEEDGDGAWYTNILSDTVIHKDWECNDTQIITLGTPRALASTSDNGFWVFDESDSTLRKYDSTGSLVLSNDWTKTIEHLYTDYQGGCWASTTDNYVYHIRSNGTIDISDIYVANIGGIHGGKYGCVVWSTTAVELKYIDRSSGTISRTIDGDQYLGGCSGLLEINVDDHLNYKIEGGILPTPSDPVWGTNGTLEWREIAKDGYFLDKVPYHQFELTLRSTPRVNSITASPTVKLQELQPQTSRDIYVKTNIPAGAAIQNYETRLKAWWGKEE
jgi:hypothetical protein